MRRRDFLACGCACLVPGLAAAQAAWEIPARFARPDAGSDEGGLWSMMDREEVRLRKSPFSLRDPKMQAYVQDIACRLAIAPTCACISCVRRFSTRRWRPTA